MASLGSSFISCTALDKTRGVRPPDTLIAKFSWVVAYLGKLFLVYNSSCKLDQIGRRFRFRLAVPVDFIQF